MLNNFAALLQTLEHTSSKVSKINLIKKHPEFKRLFELALSPYITYGVAKLPTPVPPGVNPLPWNVLLDALSKRQLTGNNALLHISRVRGSLLTSPALTAFDRILLKDLRCGVAAETVNKALPGAVPVFSCQLAPSEMPKLSELTFPIIAEPKYDGVRTIAIKRNGIVTLYSRNGKEFENFGELNEALVTTLRDNEVFDGEVISPLGFAKLMTRTKAKTGKAVDVPIEYRVFDCLTTEEWDNQTCAYSLVERRSAILLPTEYLVARGGYKLCLSIEDVEEYYAEQLAQGLEGIMLKDPNGPYTFKRNATWRKFKPFYSADLRVTDVIEGEGKYVGALGALVCTGTYDGKNVLTEVGSGFTDEQRHSLWKSNLIGRTTEIRFQELSLRQGGEVYSLRFPSFMRFRDDLDAATSQ